MNRSMWTGMAMNCFCPIYWERMRISSIGIWRMRLLREALDRLSKRERQIICLRYGIGTKDGIEMTQKEVADLLGISQSYISRLEKKIMIRLKKEIQKN